MPVTASDRPYIIICVAQMHPIMILVLCKKCLSFFGTVIMLQMFFVNSVKL